jgi:murein DD-endopeptidase MepM/ murein hydrolase activator NlpD
MATAAWQGNETAVTDRNSLLYALVAGEEVVEGPLDPTAYAGTDTPGVGGSRLAALDANVGIDLITFDDPEANFAGTLGGNAVLAPAMPQVPEPGSEEEPPRQQPHVYTVRAGDTIDSIAAEHNVSTNTVLWANGLDSKTTLKVGDHLTILPITGVLHTVASGDTVLALANEYDATTEDIIEYNGLSEEAKLSIGQKLIIPDGYIAPRAAPSIVPQDTQLATEPSGEAPPPTDATAPGLVWPTATKHISQYFRWGHTGIDIDDRSRPPVYSAAAGTVEFTGWLGGYGNLIIVNHGNGLRTYYAHLEKFYASEGQTVAKGDAIAKMGSTGRSTGPHLHFEVRQHGRPVNPLGMY